MDINEREGKQQNWVLKSERERKRDREKEREREREREREKERVRRVFEEHK